MLVYYDQFEVIYDKYKDKKAQRSEIPYMNHIFEGFMILSLLYETDPSAYQLFALHPLLSDDYIKEGLKGEGGSILELLKKSDWLSLVCMEYRGYNFGKLSRSNITLDTTKSPFAVVNSVLVADKIQNRKDFELYHKGTHPNSDELDSYFKTCLAVLGITEDFYLYLVERLNKELSNKNYSNLRIFIQEGLENGSIKKRKESTKYMSIDEFDIYESYLDRMYVPKDTNHLYYDYFMQLERLHNKSSSDLLDFLIKTEHLAEKLL